MPELPEVETIVRRLQDILPGKRFSNVKVLNDKSFSGSISQLLDTSITQVSRRAKFININLDNNMYLLTHLKMTGQLIYQDDNFRLGGGHPTADWTAQLPSKHTRIIYDFTDGSKLFFQDQRIFGWVKLLDLNDLNNEFDRFGLDINSERIKTKEQRQKIIFKIKRSSRAIKQVLLDQGIVAGLGNIYVCEALWQAQIDPRRPANTISEEQLTNILDASIAVVNKAIKFGGTTFDGKYVGVDGFSGNFQNELKVYGREGQTCERCGSEIVKIRMGGRGTYFCHRCQK